MGLDLIFPFRQMPIYRHLKKEKSKRNICSLNSASKHGWKKWRMKEGDSFPLVADKATWVWTPTLNPCRTRINIYLTFQRLGTDDETITGSVNN